MSDTKTPRVLITIAILALAGAMLLAGCGGSGGTTATDQGPPPGSNTPEATEEAPAEESEPAEAPEEESAEETGEAPAEEEAGGEEAGESAMVAEGKTVFTTNCGTCHTLAEAGTTGTVGPNLDELKPSEETVEHQVINGGGPMPAFGNEGILKPEEITAVATYVSTVAGSE
jgi:cytochrome c6